jgi:hypothetical protein
MTHILNVECTNNVLTHGIKTREILGNVMPDGSVSSLNGTEKLTFVLRGPVPPDTPFTYTNDCKMVYNDGRFNDDGTPVEVSPEAKKNAIYVTSTKIASGGKKRRSSQKKRRSSHKKHRSSHKKRRSSKRRH